MEGRPHRGRSRHDRRRLRAAVPAHPPRVGLPESGSDRAKQRRGIDGVGVLRVALLSFQVYFQCKKWKGNVRAKDIRDFRGAMVGRTDKGLFITTGSYTPDAQKEATRDGAPAIDLIDGEQLCELLKNLKLGVTTKMVEEALNFNSAIKKLFDPRYSLDTEQAFSIQFSAIAEKSAKELLVQQDLPQNVHSYIVQFENGMSQEEYDDPRFSYRVAFVRKTTNSKSAADKVVQFIPADSETGAEVNKVSSARPKNPNTVLGPS